MGQSQRCHDEGCRRPEGGWTNGSEGCSGTQGAPDGGDGPVQDPGRRTDGNAQSLGIRLSGCTAEAQMQLVADVGPGVTRQARHSCAWSVGDELACEWDRGVPDAACDVHAGGS